MSSLVHHDRHSLRLSDYDYSLEGAYFVTIVTYKRLHIFGQVKDSKVVLHAAGKIAFDQWTQLGKRFPRARFSPFVIMPNHVHGIIYIDTPSAEEFQTIENSLTAQPIKLIQINNPGSLGVIVRAYKASVTFRINTIRGHTYPPVWQRNYYEKVIHNEKEHANIWNYIEANPERWEEDQLYSM